MQDYYDRAMEVMTENFGHDVVLALATRNEDNVNVREVDCYYKDGKIYVMTRRDSQKMKDIAKFPTVALCRQLSCLYGTGCSLGHPLDEANCSIVKELRREFALFYADHVDELDEATCILEITLNKAYTFTRFHRYSIDFETKQASRDDFVPQIYYR